jgi:UDP-N-acetylmuramyl pentapeptide phosphotransferase/UDP-N-acetylglucosamine-1-phosphate transferase
VIILAGVRITGVSLFGNDIIQLDIWNYDFNFLGQLLTFSFPADLITLLWFLVIINAMNWVAGIDALEETMAWVAGLTLMFLAIKFGKTDMLELTSIFTGATIGFWFFNFPPARIFGGTVANTMLGYLLAIFAIKIDGKYTTAILLLALPLVDFLWVLIWRVVKFRQFNPLKLMSISGNHHLHHRLMEIGYSKKQTLLLEGSLFGVFAIAAYYFAGFDILAVAGVASFGLLFILFSVITIVYKRRQNRAPVAQEEVVKEEEKPDEPDDVQPPDPQKPPESVYAY